MSIDVVYVYVAHDLSATTHLPMGVFLNAYKEMLQGQILHSILLDLILRDNILPRNQSGLLYLQMWLLEFKAVHQIPHQLSPTVIHSHEMLCFVIQHYYISASLLILLILYTLTCRSRSSLRYRTAYRSILACDPYCCAGYGELSGGNCKNVNQFRYCTFVDHHVFINCVIYELDFWKEM